MASEKLWLKIMSFTSARYLNHLSQQNIDKPFLPPVPVTTRWNTWLDAAVYHAKHITLYKGFVENEIRDNASTVQLRKLSELLSSDNMDILTTELEFLAVHGERLMSTLTAFEAHNFLASDAYNKVADHLSWLRAPDFPFATENCKTAMNSAAAKLAEYVAGAKQPAMGVFKTVRIFDSCQSPLLSKSFNEHAILLPALASATEEWRIYLDIVEREEIHENLATFWSSVEKRLPKLAMLAKTYLAFPVSSVDVVRSFSKYGSVLSPLRCNLSEKNLRAYCAVFFNSKSN